MQCRYQSSRFAGSRATSIFSHNIHSEIQRPLFAPRRRFWKEGRHTDDVAQSAKTLSSLDQLRKMSVIVADTGELDLVRKYRPEDCTTNPSLVLKAVLNPEYSHLIPEALRESKQQRRPIASYGGARTTEPLRPQSDVADILAVNIGVKLLDIVPGRVSTEVDAHLSYDKQAIIDKALEIVDLYAAKGIDHSELYIKIASTWEGIEACRELERLCICCNMTLLFSFAQAAACADAGATLISPFVGRIMDWYKAKEGRDFPPQEDPGVKSVQNIYRYYKAHGYRTAIMAASFRNMGEIRELAGCDYITIAPSLLAELGASHDLFDRKLSPNMDFGDVPAKISGFTREQFEQMHGADQMAVEKLKQGIEGFSADQRKLEELIAGLVV